MEYAHGITPPSLREPTPLELRAKQAAADHAPHDCDYKIGGPCRNPDAPIAIWGDSMAGAWATGISADTYTFPACAPAVGQAGISAACRAFNDAVPARIKAGTVILAARWVQYPDGDLTETFKALRGKRVLVMGPTPRIPGGVPACIRYGQSCAVPRAKFDAQAVPILANLRQQAKPFPNVQVLDLSDQFCTRESCPGVRDGVALYFDAMHPSRTQARRVMAAISDAGKLSLAR
nr:SGNH hydrolase domain-containing protein [Lysobacter gilvus]